MEKTGSEMKDGDEESGGEIHYALFFVALSANYFAFSFCVFFFFALFHTQFVLLSGGRFFFLLIKKWERNERQKRCFVPIMNNFTVT